MKSYDSISRDVAAFLATHYDIKLDSVTPDAKLEDLGFDSLGMLSVVTLLENKHGLKFESSLITQVTTVGGLLDILRAHCSAA